MKKSHNDFPNSYVDIQPIGQEQVNEQESGGDNAFYTTKNLENNTEVNQVQATIAKEEFLSNSFDESHGQNIKQYGNTKDSNADQLSAPYSKIHTQMKAETSQINHRWFRKNKNKIRQAFMLFERILILKLINPDKYTSQDIEKKMSRKELYNCLKQEMMFNKHDKQSNAFLLFIKGIDTVQSQLLITLDFLLFIFRFAHFKGCFKKNLDDLESETTDVNKIEGIRALKAIYDFASQQ